jgi:hypothetical protein
MPREGAPYNGESYTLTSAAVWYINANDDRVIYYIEERESVNSPDRKYKSLYLGTASLGLSDISSYRSPVKIADAQQQQLFEVYQDERVFRIDKSTFSSTITKNQLDQIASGQLSIGGILVYQPSVYKDKFYADNPRTPITITSQGTVRIANLLHLEALIPQNIFSLDDIKKCVGISEWPYGIFYTLLNNGDLYFYSSQSTNDLFVLCDSSIRDITYSEGFSQVVGITTTYDLKRFSSINAVAGSIHSNRKYQQIGKRYAIQYFA